MGERTQDSHDQSQDMQNTLKETTILASRVLLGAACPMFGVAGAKAVKTIQSLETGKKQDSNPPPDKTLKDSSIEASRALLDVISPIIGRVAAKGLKAVLKSQEEQKRQDNRAPSDSKTKTPPEQPPERPKPTQDIDGGSAADVEKEKQDARAARDALDSQIDAKKDALNELERKTLKDIGHAILNGDLKGLENILQNYKDNPHHLDKLMTELAGILRPAGVIMIWQVGKMMMSGDKDFHDVGSLKIFKHDGNRYVELSTDSRLGTGVGGPVRREGDRYMLNFLAFTDDPAKHFKEIGQVAVKNLSRKEKQDKK